MFDDHAGLFIQPGAEPGKGLEFLELGIDQFEISRHPPVDCPLRLAADPRHRLPDIDGGQYAQSEQGRREEDLAVGDRDQVGGDIGGNILGLGFDDRQGREGTASEFIEQMCRPFQQT